MLREIESLAVDLSSKKIAPRKKAFVSLYDILNNRLSELQEFLNEDEDYSWEKLFKATHRVRKFHRSSGIEFDFNVGIYQGLTMHSAHICTSDKELNENDTNITHYSRTILTLCDCAGELIS